MKDIGAAIRKRREKLGWTVQKLATLAEVNNGHLSRLERGEAGWSVDSITRIAGALGVSPEVLMAGDPNVVPAPSDFRRIPVLDYVQAGAWRGVMEHRDPDQQEYVTINLEVPPSTFAMYIQGDSMEPEFHTGDLVVIAPPVQPRPGDFVVAKDENGDATFKRYREIGLSPNRERIFELTPLNANHASWRSDVQKIAIVGVMIEHRRFRRP